MLSCDFQTVCLNHTAVE